MNITYCRATTDGELRQILALQRQNSLETTSSVEKKNEGFVTVSHDFDTLKQMNDSCPHIIAKDGDVVVGYALVMRKEFSDRISILSAMFETATQLLGDKNYVAMGQVCIAKAYRKKGIFKAMYLFYRAELQQHYDCLLTEVATVNQRSLQAHLSLGFTVLKTQISDGVCWELIIWDWT